MIAGRSAAEVRRHAHPLPSADDATRTVGAATSFPAAAFRLRPGPGRSRDWGGLPRRRWEPQRSCSYCVAAVVGGSLALGRTTTRPPQCRAEDRRIVPAMANDGLPDTAELVAGVHGKPVTVAVLDLARPLGHRSRAPNTQRHLGLIAQAHHPVGGTGAAAAPGTAKGRPVRLRSPSVPSCTHPQPAVKGPSARGRPAAAVPAVRPVQAARARTVSRSARQWSTRASTSHSVALSA
jgi:hypothetical protein